MTDFVTRLARKWAGEMLAERALEGLLITAKVRSVYEAMVAAAIREALAEAEKVGKDACYNRDEANAVAAAIAALKK